MDTERLRQFQELIALEPDDTVLRFGLGELYIEAKDFASAAEQFAEILRLDPHYSAAYRYLGQAYAALGRASEGNRLSAGDCSGGSPWRSANREGDAGLSPPSP